MDPFGSRRWNAAHRKQAQILNQFLTNSPLKRSPTRANRRTAAPARAPSVKYQGVSRFAPSNSTRTRIINLAQNRMARNQMARGKTNARTSFRASGGVGGARWTVTPAGNYRRAGASAIRQR